MTILGSWPVLRRLLRKNSIVADFQENQPVTGTDPAPAEEAQVLQGDRDDLPLITRDDMLFARAPDGSYRLLRWHHDGPPIQALLPGWHAVWIFSDFAPIHFIEMNGPANTRATWLIDDEGIRLGDRISALSKEHQTRIASYLTFLLADRSPASMEALASYQRLCNSTRVQVESLLPNATYDRGLELGQAIAAGSGRNMRTVAEVTGLTPHGLAPELVEGWRKSDLEGRLVCMAIGHSSVIRFSMMPEAAVYYVSLSIGLLRMSRRLSVTVNGRLIAVNPLNEVFQSQHSRLGYWIAPELVRQGVIEMVLTHDLATDFSDEAFVLEHITLELDDGMDGDQHPVSQPDKDLMGRFESLGDNCQFGFVQRHFGAEPMGLLRFAGVGSGGIPDLVQLFESGLVGLGDPGTVTYFLAGAEYMIRESRYDIVYHTFKYTNSVSPEEVIAENEIKLRYLARKFLEDLEDAEKIWLIRRVVSNDINEILALRAAMRRYGQNKLLWVTRAPQDRSPGDVDRLAPDLLKGYLAANASNDPSTFDPDHWRAICRNANRVMRNF